MTRTGPQGRTQPPQTDPIGALLASPPDLPVVEVLPELRERLSSNPSASDDAGTCLVLTAPPGTGKTTLVPPLLADVLADVPAAAPGRSLERRPGRVVVTQPRRIAARAAARRLADLLGEEVGGTVGYAVRGERRTGPDTRIEVVTAGLLLRRLQHDPELSGVDAVILDEVHERSLDSDLLLTLLADARAALREDLTVVAMSATLDADRLRRILGGTSHGAAPLVEVPGRLHSLEEVWAPPGRTGRLGPRGVPREFLAHVATTVERALAERSGDVLVFLPGAREVDDVISRLRGAALAGVDVLPLHGRLPASAQDAALAPSPAGRRRVVVATNVAESSLTVPGVRVVVDSTLAREPRLDVARSMSGLVTVGVSRAAGVQRAGRAGREGSGVVYRCCSPTDWARSPLAPTPEILSADLTGAALELAVWGVPDGAGLAWVDEPPAAALGAAREALERLGLAGADGVTPLGRAVAGLPAGVREARALLATAPALGARRAARATALLTADLRAPGGDLTALARQVQGGGAGSGAWKAEARRLEQACRRAVLEQSGRAEDPGPASGGPQAPGATGAAGSLGTGRGRETSGRPEDPAAASGGPQAPDATHGREETGRPGDIGGDAPGLGDGEGAASADLESAVALVAGTAQPQWIARRRGPAPQAGKEAHYASVAGTGLRLPAGSALAESEWLAVAGVDLTGGRGDALIRAAAPLEEQTALELAGAWLAEEERAVWEGGRLRIERLRRLGAITLTTTPGPPPGPTAVADAVVARVRAEGADAGLGVLPWDEEALSLRARLALLHEHLGEPWPDMSDAALAERAEEWLAPAVASLAGQTGGSGGPGRSGESASSGLGGRRFSLERLDMAQALRALLPWPQAARLDELVPERLEVPSGSQVPVDYTAVVGGAGPVDPAEAGRVGRPVLAVRVQECFGWATTPRIVEGRVAVLLHLLSPARRPVAVTDDLASFWEQGYPQVRAEMRGRYPKHAWPEDPWNTPATKGTRRRR
ncbi:ATP-dependent helicase C-terminal domain-containing protein [Actinomyces oris]|uniref:ATP-dependent helicase C-terminal domain-containing protein n=1 Tax=Actinomyces oris TaxID=544580 RepID=A0AAW9KVL7_9ACTO|nr:ATP-dependent helicase C-terminal domain-containing protein [Actinomyces oris]MEA1305038.1 ATP-dependent helicase C-terminal domain-containing protein [Actinomyces oris]